MDEITLLCAELLVVLSKIYLSHMKLLLWRPLTLVLFAVFAFLTLLRLLRLLLI
jgi:hypothetical protein